MTLKPFVRMALYVIVALAILTGPTAEEALPDGLHNNSLPDASAAGYPFQHVAMQQGAPTQYLAFQIFTGSPQVEMPLGPSGPTASYDLSTPPPKRAIAAMVQTMIDKIGSTGDKTRKLAFTPGPLAFDHSDEDLQRLIRDSFEIVRAKDIAVAFHIDDSIFWGKRRDLWSKTENVEWLDWGKTPNTGRRIDWSPTPVSFAPQMCFNSKDIQREVKRFAGMLGKAIKKELDSLDGIGKAELFAGVIVGWETQIGRDFQTGRHLGYCALTNKGFGAQRLPKDIDLEREIIVREFIELWAKALTDAGVPKPRIYSHTAFVSRKAFDQMIAGAPSRPHRTYSQSQHFAPPSVSFSQYYQPGFSTYPQPGLLEQIYQELSNHGNPTWASSEGTAIGGAAMESYLAGLFNHGATLVNIFAWGVGPDRPENTFRHATENREAIWAYRRFLQGRALRETSATTPPQRLQSERLPGQ